MSFKNIFYSIIAIFYLASCSSDEEDPQIFLTTEDFKVEIDENPVNGQVIGSITGSTNSGTLSYSIISQTPTGAFSVDPNSGSLKVLDESIFDFEVNPSIIGVVEVTNGQLNELSKVTIDLLDVEEDVFNGNITLTTQEEINSFGANGYKIINGDLIIDEDQLIHDIVFLDALSTIEEIKGDFKINNLFNLLDLPSFEKLVAVGSMEITNNWGILDLHSLLNISKCDGPITITNNTSLGSFCGIRPLLQSGNFNDTYTVADNFYNPSEQDVIDGNCENF